MTFETLGLSPALLRALAENSYTTPTPIQLEAIPLALAGHDLLGGAQTGTGKTAAFSLPLLQRLSKETPPNGPRKPRALILTPTRELAVQVADSIKTYGRHLRLNVTTIFGGAGMGPQVDNLRRGIDILVATPGPPDRPHGARQRQARRRRDAGARRSRPHARHGLPAGDQAHPQPRAEGAPDAAVLGDVRGRDQGARAGVHARSEAGAGDGAATPSPKPSCIARIRSMARASATC